MPFPPLGSCSSSINRGLSSTDTGYSLHRGMDPTEQFDIWARSHYETDDVAWMWKDTTQTSMDGLTSGGFQPSATTAPNESSHSGPSVQHSNNSGPTASQDTSLIELRTLPDIGQHLPELDCNNEAFMKWLFESRQVYFEDHNVTKDEKKQQLSTIEGRKRFPPKALGHYPSSVYKNCWRRICWACWHREGRAYVKTEKKCDKCLTDSDPAM